MTLTQFLLRESSKLTEAFGCSLLGDHAGVRAATDRQNTALVWLLFSTKSKSPTMYLWARLAVEAAEYLGAVAQLAFAAVDLSGAPSR